MNGGEFTNMAETAGARRITATAPTNIYSVLTILGTLFVLAGIVFLAVKSNQLFGEWMPLGPTS
jgi:hypothetical protein